MSRSGYYANELTKSQRRRLTRRAHKLARSGQYQGYAAIIAEIRKHQDFHAPTHENQLLLFQLDLVCSYAWKKLTISALARAPRSRGHGCEGLASGREVLA
jgi:hypothetical protein